jgi:16S rRNA (cytidine1402-2'-O)-methyltransferase
MSKGKLYLIPAIIADDTQELVIPLHVRQVLPSIKYFLAEDVRTARRYLSSLKIYTSIESLSFEVLNKDTQEESLKTLFEPVFKGENTGVLSESGCPGVADPGALAVKFAHENEVQVIPLVGPSSLLLALMASGLNGQHFAFHGYLPVDSKEATSPIKAFEKESQFKQQTQIFIETPYRNNQLMATLLKTLADDTLLCVALDVTGKSESIRTLTVRKWKSMKTDFPKCPAVFLFLRR